MVLQAPSCALEREVEQITRGECSFLLLSAALSQTDTDGRIEHVPRGGPKTLIEDCMEIRATQGIETGVVDQLLLVSEEMKDCIPTEFGVAHKSPFKLG